MPRSQARLALLLGGKERLFFSSQVREQVHVPLRRRSTLIDRASD